MINEADYKRRLVKAVRALPGGWARRIEDKFAVGVLDLVIKMPQLPVIFAEGKVIDGNVFGPTLRQWEEGKAIEAAGVRAVLLGWKSGVMYISPWVAQANRLECDQSLGTSPEIHAYALQTYLNRNP